jgi:peroxiredoxin Q/BCP
MGLMRATMRVRVVLYAVGHALCAPLPGRTFAPLGQRPLGCSRPIALRPPDANGIGNIDGPKTTKGRRMAKQLEPGDKAPEFRLATDGGGSVSLKDFKGRKLVLYFYPKADTSGCTKEAIAFTRLKSAFAKAGADILGVSGDAVAAIDKFKKKHKLDVILASDEGKDMLTAYGVWGEKSMWGRLFMGVKRMTFLIDEKGRIARVWSKVKVDRHAEDVLEAVRAL